MGKGDTFQTMTHPPDERISMSTEQLDDLLKDWKRKGASRALAFIMVGSIPLAIIGGFLSNIAPGQVVIGCATYYCAVAALAILTQ